MRTCVFAGTFDPMTEGHEKLIKKCLNLFDKVVIAVGVNAEKKPFFSLEERKSIIKKAFEGNKMVEVEDFSGLLVEFMKKKGYTIYVRGIRNQEDYEYENTMAIYNKDMYPELTTVFIPSDVGESYVSSSAVRTIINLNGEYDKYLPKNAIELTKKIIEKKQLEK